MNERIRKIEADLAARAAEVQPLVEKSKAGSLTTDEDARFDDLVSQINAGKADLAKAIEQAKFGDTLGDLTKGLNGPADETISREHALGFTAAKAAGDDPDMRSAGQKFVQSEQYKKALKTGNFGGIKDNPVDMATFGPDGEKALIYSGTASASALLAQVLPTIYRAPEKPLVMEDVLLSMTTNSDTVTVLQESGFTNGAVEVAEATSVSEGAKPESAITFTEVSFPVRTIAHWLPVTRQMLEDLSFMGSYIDQRLLDGLARRKDNQIINGTGVAPNITGILATSGIQNLDATYFSGAPVNDAGTDNENINRVRRAKRVVQVTGDATPTFVVLNPADKEQLDTQTDGQRQYLLNGPLAPTNTTLWGLPVVESQNIAAGTAIVGDGTMAAVADRNQARIYTSDSHSDFFIRNIIVVLAEQRIAFPVFRPAAFAKVTLAAWA